jgi:hypothetical protein
VKPEDGSEEKKMNFFFFGTCEPLAVATYFLFLVEMPINAGPVAIEEWAEKHKDSFKPPICNKVLLPRLSILVCVILAQRQELRV